MGGGAFECGIAISTVGAFELLKLRISQRRRRRRSIDLLVWYNARIKKQGISRRFARYNIVLRIVPPVTAKTKCFFENTALPNGNKTIWKPQE
jgi:hypothetical protein